MTATVERDGDRIGWPDLARGLCIVLVVSGHITTQLFVHLDVPYQVRDAWVWINKGFAPMRLPLFFLVSGFLSASAIRRPWSSVILPRMVTPYYLYIIWAIPLPLIYASINSNIHYGRIESFWDAFVVLLIPNSSVWYLYALAAYFLGAKCLARAPKYVVLALAMIISMTAATWGGDTVIASIGHYPVFYILGAYFPAAIRAVADNRGATLPFVGSLTYACALATYVIGWQNMFGVRTLCGIIGAGTGLIIVSRLSLSLGSIGAKLKSLGRQTLPIFILHYPLLAVLAIPLGPVASTLPGIIVSFLPVILLIALIPLSLLIYRLLINVRLGFLFHLPHPFSYRTRSARSS